MSPSTEFIETEMGPFAWSHSNGNLEVGEVVLVVSSSKSISLVASFYISCYWWVSNASLLRGHAVGPGSCSVVSAYPVVIVS